MVDAITHMFERMDPQAFMALMIPIFAVVGVMLVGVVALIIKHLQHTRQRELDTSLKHEMIARGMSADEIERVLAAKSAPVEAGSSPGSITVTQNWSKQDNPRP